MTTPGPIPATGNQIGVGGNNQGTHKLSQKLWVLLGSPGVQWRRVDGTGKGSCIQEMGDLSRLPSHDGKVLFLRSAGGGEKSWEYLLVTGVLLSAG